jgi:hypothetical protein
MYIFAANVLKLLLHENAPKIYYILIANVGFLDPISRYKNETLENQKDSSAKNSVCNS